MHFTADKCGEKVYLGRTVRTYIIIDDIGYEVLFALIADRYERSSIMLTSNLPFSGW